MKKSMFVMMVAMLLSVSAFAQQPNKCIAPKGEIPTAEQIAKCKADRMQKQLLLGKEQYDKVYQLCLAQAEQQVERMKACKAEKEKMAGEMKGILNEAQYERFEQMQNGPRYQHPGRPGRRYEPCEKPGVCPKKKYCEKAPECKAPEVEPTMKAEPQIAPKDNREIKKGERIRVVRDRNRNQNAYNYIEDKKEDKE